MSLSLAHWIAEITTMPQLQQIPQIPTPNSKICRQCASPVEIVARFCGECGSPEHHAHHLAQPLSVPAQAYGAVGVSSAQAYAYPRLQSAPFAVHDAVHETADSHQRAPSFAGVSPTLRSVNPALQEELSKTIVLLARERLFLYFHCLIFLGLNLLGFWLSLKAHAEYNADELTKTVIALTPLMFVNSVAMFCLAPIKGTKQEIHSLRERVTYLRHAIEYQNII